MTNLLLPALAIGGVYWLYTTNKEEQEKERKEVREDEVDLVDALRREIDIIRKETGSAPSTVRKAEAVAEIAEEVE
jgi:hypothetical protein